MEALMLMPILLKRSGSEPTGLAAVTIALLGLGILTATPAFSGEIYSWDTGDGHIAFTDNPKNIPARYRDQVTVRQSEGIQDYKRFTAEDSARTDHYAEQLAQRIEYLRRVNGRRETAPPPVENVGVATISVSGVDLRLPAADTSEPLIVQKLRVKASGQISTRHDTLVSQGGTPLAIIRGNQEGEVGAANNILAEEDLDFYR
jgi:hypothetical protein